jgi:hypothetical protein
MNLPWLGLQAVWAHFAWGMVLAACGVAVLARRRPFPSALGTVCLVLALAICALPGAASPSYWLGLAFQFPSALLVACCAMTIWTNAQGNARGHRVLPAGLAAALVGIGLLLYLDSAGWLAWGLYARGFGPEAAIAGLLVGLAAVLAVARGRHRGAAFAVLLCVALFALLRLPTGNVWDALLDPLLWLWALFSLLARALASRSAANPAQPA